MRVTTDIALRNASTSDVPAIRNILWTTWLATYASFIPLEDLEEYFEGHYSSAAIDEILGDPSARISLAIVGGSLAGTMITRFKREERRLYVSSLYVLPAFQGLGVGGRLLVEAEARARESGLNAIWLGVMVQNVKTVEWYEKIGFRFDERQPFVMGKTSVEHLIGYKSIVVPGRS